MSRPPGASILNRSPYNGEPAWPSIGGAPKRGLETTVLPSGSLSAESSSQIEFMANATATFPLFISPFASDNEFLENDIVCARIDNQNDGVLADMNGIYARPLRLLRNDENINQYFDGGDAQEKAINEMKRWRIMGIVVSVGHGGPNDRQVINVSVRGRTGMPCIFTPQSINKDGSSRNLHRGDEFFVVLSAVKVVGAGIGGDDRGKDGQYKIDVSLCSLRSVSDVPANAVPANQLGNRNRTSSSSNSNEVDFRIWLSLGTYIRPTSAVTSSRNAVERYLNGGNTILDRRTTYEVAYRL